MTTLKIPYNQDSYDLLLSWDSAEESEITPPSVYSVEIFRGDTGATVLPSQVMQEVNPGVYSLAADVSAGDATFETSQGLSTVTAGQSLRIMPSADGPAEDVTISHVDGTTVTIDRHFLDDHSTGALVKSMWTVYDLDTSDTDLYELGLELVVRVSYFDGIIPAPEGGNFTPQEYRAKVVKIGYVPTDIRQTFSAVYPTVYQIIDENYDTIEEEAIDRVSIWLEQRGRDINMITNSAILRPAIMEQIYLLGAPRGDQWETERASAQDELNTQLSRLEELPIWFDEDQDDQQDDSEIGIGAWRPYMRGL